MALVSWFFTLTVSPCSDPGLWCLAHLTTVWGRCCLYVRKFICEKIKARKEINIFSVLLPFYKISFLCRYFCVSRGHPTRRCRDCFHLVRNYYRNRHWTIFWLKRSKRNIFGKRILGKCSALSGKGHRWNGLFFSSGHCHIWIWCPAVLQPTCYELINRLTSSMAD